MLRELHNRSGAHAQFLNFRIRRLQLAVLILAILTTGSLWAIISKTYPQFATWCGAILGTTLTGLTGFQNIHKFEEKYSETLALYNEVGLAMSQIRQTNNFKPDDFWGPYKSFETKCLSLGIPLPTNLKRLSAKWGEGSPTVAPKPEIP